MTVITHLVRGLLLLRPLATLDKAPVMPYRQARSRFERMSMKMGQFEDIEGRKSKFLDATCNSDLMKVTTAIFMSRPP